MRSFSLFLVLLISGIIAACARIGGGFLPDEDARRVLSILAEKEEQHSRVLLYGTARSKIPGRSISTRFFMVIEKPERLRFDGLDPFGNTIISAVLSRNEGIVCIPLKNTTYRAEDTERLIRHFTGISITVYDFVSLFMNEASIKGKIFESLRRNEKNGYMITMRNENQSTHFVYTVSEGYDIDELRIQDENNSVVLQMQYSDFMRENNINFPKRINIKIPSYSAWMELRVEDIEMDVEISDDTFYLKIPAGMKIINLDEKI